MATPKNADFIGRVVKDPKNPPETRLLTGWLGDAAEEGYRRLYTDAELSAYVDIPADAILYTEPIRDSQPAGGVFVWIKRDAVLKPGGSASSRAARFLQGQVQQDFASAGGGADPEPGSIEKAGYRCVTQVPCGEPTGFTGRCTKQPVVGGAWPCITLVPHCSEPTGFTGQCTHQPWPNPTQYVGCTIYHCPTRDLTHIQQICNIVATGIPGCPVVDPLGGGIDPAAKASAEAADEGGSSPVVRPTPPVPLTAIPGCGYTRTWGLCPTLPQKCQVSVNIPCITQTETPQCRGIDLAAARQFGAASQICATNIGCNITLFCPPAAGARVVNTQQIQCNPSAVDACPTRLCNTVPPTGLCTQIPEACPPTCGPQCQTQQQSCTQVSCTQVGPQCPSLAGTICPTTPQLDCTFGCTQAGTGCPVTSLEHACNMNAAAGAQAFRAAGPGGQTAAVGCTQTGNNCLTIPDGDCTFFGGCQQTLATVCTQSGPQCPTHAQPHCTCAGPGCPPTPATVCTQSGLQCPSQFGSGCRTDMQLDCTFHCPAVTTPELSCNTPNVVAARAQAFGTAAPLLSLGVGCTLHCPPRSQQFVACTLIDPQCSGTVVGTIVGPQCHTPVVRCPQPSHPFVACTLIDPQCSGTVAGTIVGPQCHTPVVRCPQPSNVFFACTSIDPNCSAGVGTIAGPQCQAFARAAQVKEPTPATVCFICTQVPWLCPVAQ